MFNIFNSDVFVEIGEAIGNIRKRIFPRRSQADALDEAFRRHLQDPIPLHLPDKTEKPARPDEGVIEGTYRILDKEEK
jgi:hypothetical protein